MIELEIIKEAISIILQNTDNKQIIREQAILAKSNLMILEKRIKET